MVSPNAARGVALVKPYRCPRVNHHPCVSMVKKDVMQTHNVPTPRTDSKGRKQPRVNHHRCVSVSDKSNL